MFGRDKMDPKTDFDKEMMEAYSYLVDIGNTAMDVHGDVRRYKLKEHLDPGDLDQLLAVCQELSDLIEDVTSELDRKLWPDEYN
jgi:hypothetical protein